MRTFLIACAMLFWLPAVAAAQVQPSSQTIRDIDFNNFTFPWRYLNPWSDFERDSDFPQWLNNSELGRVTLTAGRHADEETENEVREIGTDSVYKGPFIGLTLTTVDYGDLTGDSQDEGIVTVRWDSGGTQYYYRVYVYGLESQQPKLMAYFLTGERASHGLYHVYIKDRTLVVELYDPDKRQGDCCSTGYLRKQYRWNRNSFAKVGETETGTPDAGSRRPVTVFGTPVDQLPNSR